jgi:hypothetical protein
MARAGAGDRGGETNACTRSRNQYDSHTSSTAWWAGGPPPRRGAAVMGTGARILEEVHGSEDYCADELGLLATFGECQVMTHPVAKRLFISSLIIKSFRGYDLPLDRGSYA